MNGTDKSNSMLPQYDMIIVGSSLLCCFEAIYQHKLGNKVLMIDRANQIGGAWGTLQLFGFSGVENAVHYFLPNDVAINFLSKALGLKIESSQKKFQIFNIRFLNYLKLPFDSRITRMVARFFALKNEFPNNSSLNLLYKTCCSLLEKRRASFYPTAGSIAILEKTRSLIKNLKIDIKFETHISTVKTNSNGDGIEAITDKGIFQASQILVTHGTQIENYYSRGRVVRVRKKNHRRPACHLLVDDTKAPKFYEAVFVDSKTIKYVHDITRYLKNAKQIIGRMKLFVFALHPEVKNTKQVGLELLKELRNAGLIDDCSNLRNFQWSEVFLPSIDDADLIKLEKSFCGSVKIMKTENFTSCVGENAARWERMFVT